MPTYVVLANFTDQGAKTISGTIERSHQVRARIESRGGKIEALYWTMGPYDLTIVVETPDDEAQLTGLFELAAAGNVRTLTMRAFAEREVQSALGKMG